MPSLNKVMLIGNVTRELELKYTPTGRAVIDVGLAVNRKWNDNGFIREEVTFIDVTFWGKAAETLAQYLHKGDPFYCGGRLGQESWTDKETGKKRTKTRITGEEFEFLGTRRGGKDDEAPAARPGPSHNPPAPHVDRTDHEDEIPF